MAAPKKPTHTVNHDRLNFMVAGKMTRLTRGQAITLTAKQAEKAGNMVKSINTKEAVDLTPKEKGE